MKDKLTILKHYWGHSAFRPKQEEIIDSVLQGHDTLVLMPTGGGKSICYQLPALMMEGMCLVVSPLIALMRDQVQQLNNKHIAAAGIVSGMSSAETMGVLSNCITGRVKLLYVSPERLRQRSFIENYRNMKVSLIAVDEAHCVSQWGYDFRPPYLQIADIRKYHPTAPLIALTATATPTVVADIKERLKMRNCQHFQTSFERSNLSYIVIHDEDKINRLTQLIKKIGGSGIVYTRSRRGTRLVTERLEAEGITAAFYHAGLDPRERDRRQTLWMNNKCQVMVATNAFGMGIDKADVRFVIHVDAPDSIEAYFQEAGRAGRNGERAYAILICSKGDNTRLHSDFDATYPPVKYIRNVYRAICNYYRIPTGSGADTTFDYDAERICATYNLKPRLLYSACRFLEREGLISLPEHEQAYSTLFIPLNRDELYRFQIDHLRLGDALQNIIRIYPGLFTCAIPIDERKIANHCLCTPAEISAMLSQMHNMHIVEYQPRSHAPQIVFTSERINERNINLGTDNYDLLKDSALLRIEAMEQYMDNDETCRNRQLLAYFGEKLHGNDCGHCDVCLSRIPPSIPTEDAILNLLSNASLSPQDARHTLEDQGHYDTLDTIRDMLDEGTIYLDENLLLRIP